MHTNKCCSIEGANFDLGAACTLALPGASSCLLLALGECWISRRYKRALTGTANGGRHKAMPCLAEEVLKAHVGQPAFQQLKGAAALYCQSPSLSRSLAARHIGAPLSPVC